MNTHSKLKQFQVYHPKNGEMNMCCKIDTHEYEYIGSVESETLVRVFYRTQNDFNPSYAELGRRSTSVGDIIVHHNHVYMVQPVGFKRIPTTKPLYQNIMELNNIIIKEKVIEHESKS